MEVGYDRNKICLIGCLLPSTYLPFEEYKRVMQYVIDWFDEPGEIGPVILSGD